MIARPITEDGLVGFDKNGTLFHCTVSGDYKTFRGIADVRRDWCIICDRGWQETSESLGDQYLWDLTKTHVHLTCFVRYQGLGEREEVWRALVEAKVRFGGLHTIPNQYWAPPDPWSRKPWYTTELVEHPVKITIGSRKHVLQIVFTPQGGTKLEWWEKARDAFEGETVTKEFSKSGVLLHAWGTEKLRAYVKQIAEIAGYAAR
jgi:hypothetical protein